MVSIIYESIFPFFIILLILFFFLSILISIVFKIKFFTFFLFFFITISLLFFFFYKYDLLKFSLFQFELNSQFFIFFIFSEFCFFGGVFWGVFWGFYAFDFHNGNLVFSIIGIYKIYPFSLPLVNTFLLLSSAAFATIYHESFLIFKNEISLFMCILFGLIFLIIQYFEFNLAIFNFSYTTFGSLFFFSTGFHGFHVFLGLTFLIIFCLSFYFNNVYSDKYLNVSLLYWHFVDVVWLFLFIFVYVFPFYF